MNKKFRVWAGWTGNGAAEWMNDRYKEGYELHTFSVSDDCSKVTVLMQLPEVKDDEFHPATVR